MYQPPEPSGVGRCLRCASCIEESEQVGGICYECQPAEQGKEPAFPVQASDYGGHGSSFGLTIRDYFAAKALAAIIGHPNKEPENCGRKAVPRLAAWAYEYADAMLAARVKP
ncbi:hypothetical protein [Pseudomonas sp. 1121_17]|uniref:hypothetical protein n=1 Tax=Pseudomonas sp. 1121_17 TaxID=2604458 RepID=UPI004064623A